MNLQSETLFAFYMDDLRSNPLFSGMSDAEITAFFAYAKPEYMELEPEQHISIAPGDHYKLGVVLTGSVTVFTTDYSGGKTVLNTLRNTGHIGTMQFMVSKYNVLYEVVAETPSTLAMVNPEVLVVTNEAFVTVQHKMLVNLMAAQRQLFMSLSQHLICLSQKTIRDKVLRYLQIKSEAERSYEFTLSLSREDMASYLSVDRASLSRTLGELKREGVIDFRKNHFKILSTQYFKY